MPAMRPAVFRPFAGCARSVRIGRRPYVEGDLVLVSDEDVARLAPGYGGRAAFDVLSAGQVETLARLVSYQGPPAGLADHLLGLSQAALNEARDRIRGIGDSPDPSPIPGPAVEAEPVDPDPAEVADVDPDPSAADRSAELAALGAAELREIIKGYGIKGAASLADMRAIILAHEETLR